MNIPNEADEARRSEQDIAMRLLAIENGIAEAISARDKEWKQEYGKLVEQSRKELADKDAEWIARENKLLTAINKMISKLKKGNTIGRTIVGDRGIVKDIFICDKYGDEVPDTVYTLEQLKQSMGVKP